MKTITIKYGLMAGLLVTALLFIPFFALGPDFDMGIGEVIGYTSMVVAMCTVFFGIRHYRNHERGGIITFWKAMQVGLLISLVAGSVFYVANFIFYATMGDKFYPRYEAYYLESLKKSGKPTAEIEKKLNEYRRDMEANRELYTNPFFQAFVMFSSAFLIGLLISIISALVLKKEAHKAVYNNYGT